MSFGMLPLLYSFNDTLPFEFPNLNSLTNEMSPTEYILNSINMCRRNRIIISEHSLDILTENNKFYKFQDHGSGSIFQKEKLSF